MLYWIQSIDAYAYYQIPWSVNVSLVKAQLRGEYVREYRIHLGEYGYLVCIYESSSSDEQIDHLFCLNDGDDDIVGFVTPPSTNPWSVL